MAMGIGWNECLVNGEPLANGWSIECATDWVSGPSPRFCLRSPEGTLCQLDERCDWVIIDGKLVWGTPQKTSPHAVPPGSGPDRITGKIIGYRGWTLDGYKLRSANHKQHGGFWNIGPNKAVCRIEARREYLTQGHPWMLGALDVGRLAPPGHDAPHPDCECGLYAYFDVRRENNPHNYRPGDLIWGAVAAWGRVEVHSSGFRAEYAEPVVLAYSPRDAYEDVVNTQTIAGELGLPFVTFDELPAEAAKHGQTVPESMCPAPTPGFASGAPVSVFTSKANASPVVESLKKMQEEILGYMHGITEREMRATFLPTSVPAWETQWIVRNVSGVALRPKPVLREKGIKKTLKTNGPPTLGKWQLNDRVKDRRAIVWVCVKPGEPGTWERA